jgi:hypothetical protein
MDKKIREKEIEKMSGHKGSEDPRTDKGERGGI